MRGLTLTFWGLALLVGIRTLAHERELLRRVDALTLSLKAERERAVGLLSTVYQASGQKLDLGMQLARIAGDVGRVERLPAGLKLIGVVAENACGDCHDREIELLKVDASRATSGTVVVVVVSSQVRFAEAIRERVGPGIEVFWDPGGLVPGAIGIGEDQLVALVSSDERLLAVHVPLPGARDLAIPFHERAFRELRRGQG